MYIPKLNEMNDRDEVLSFIKEYSFATIINYQEGKPTASHLPLVIETREDEIIIFGHFAKANPQWQFVENQKTLIVFSEPHAYISPSNYESKINVPTWNYIAVHVYGNCVLITDEDASISILEKTINTYEAEYKKQWDELPSDYKNANLQGIVCFEMKVSEIQAKKKLSQNKRDTERTKIIHQLEQSQHTHQKKIADHMRNDELNRSNEK